MIKHKLKTIQYNQSDIIKAKTISPHYQDALHALLAKKAKADILITRNLVDFQGMKDLIKAELPENV